MNKEIRKFLEENYEVDSEAYVDNCEWIAHYDEYDDKLLAVVGIDKYNDRLVFVKHMVVRKDMRGIGVFNIFFEELKDHKLLFLARKVICHVRSTNFQSLFPLLKRGFIVEGVMRNNDAVGSHIYTLGLEL